MIYKVNIQKSIVFLYISNEHVHTKFLNIMDLQSLKKKV